MSRYVKEINEIKKLSFSEEKELFKRFRNGDSEARNLLIKHNMHVILKVIYRYNYKLWLDLDDIISVGVFGLIKAVNTYDETREVEFGGFAFICIRAEINTHFKYLYREKRRYFDDLSLQKKFFISNYDKVELESIIYSEDDFVEKAYEEKNLSNKMEFILSKLTKAERELIKMRFGFIDDEYHSCEKVGRIMGIDGEVVRVKCLKAINKLRHPKITKQIKDFV